MKFKRFAFINDSAEKEYKSLPEDIQDEFGRDLRRIQFGEKPELTIKHLDAVGQGAIELIINQDQAYRCIYVTKYLDTVVVLHAFNKKVNGVDKPAMKLAKDRLKELIAESKAIH